MEHFAVHWAAKEAVLKALNSGWRRGFAWTDIEVLPEAAGPPQVLLAGAARDLAQRQNVAAILLSLSHCRAYATAYALALRGPASTPLS
jgi:holo-[acyl-carrier protein] synthase